ncbi:MAG: hypothetical protein QNJ13_04280 [Paracoccaceae bacterium]|nr:hypothetical protein [Paracoccaceae bacterium]
MGRFLVLIGTVLAAAAITVTVAVIAAPLIGLDGGEAAYLAIPVLLIVALVWRLAARQKAG